MTEPTARRTTDRVPMSSLGRLSAWWWTALFLLALLAVTPLDSWLYRELHDPDVEDSDTFQVFRVFGHLPAWLLLAASMYLVTPRRSRRPWFAKDNADPTMDDRVSVSLAFFLAPGLGGTLAELVKLFSGRMRPEMGDGLYAFKPLFGGFVDGSNLGFASSHAATAMGGALIVAYRFPRLAFVLVPAALACGVARVLGGAHFATDVIAGWGLGALAAYWLREAALPVSELPAMTRPGAHRHGDDA